MTTRSIIGSNRFAGPLPHAGQRGFALAMALIMLALMTILGVTVMNVTSVEARMAGNMQEAVRALGTAESTFERFRNDPNAFANIPTIGSQTAPQNYSYGNGESGEVTNTYKVRGEKPPRARDPAQIFSNGYQTANFQFDSTGTTALDGKAVLESGVTQVVPSQK